MDTSSVAFGKGKRGIVLAIDDLLVRMTDGTIGSFHVGTLFGSQTGGNHGSIIPLKLYKGYRIQIY